MKNVTKNLSPKEVFYFFEEISKIPRGSKKEKKISDWLVQFAVDRNLEVHQDKFLNVIIKKNATHNYENYSPIILQGHMDMVWEKNNDTIFDFDTQGIDLVINDNFLKANGTTLGADNGIAVAIILAILDSNDLKHPSIEAIITADEEAGMTGVENINVSLLKGKTMLNIDTEEEGEIYVSSAGGSRVQMNLPFQRDNIIENSVNLLIEIKGLNGGHSGSDIDKNLGNSIKILSFLLLGLKKDFNFKLFHINGGDKTNAIPRESSALINISNTDLINFKEKITLLFNNIKLDYHVTDPGLNLSIIDNLNENNNPISQKNTWEIINFICEIPSGVINYSLDIENLVETSLSLGVLRTNENTISVQLLLRSSKNDALKELEIKLEDLSKLYHAEFIVDSSYSSWEYNPNSQLREIFTKSHESLYKKVPKIKAIHAGLECGIFTSKIKDLDVISIGPNIYGAHTPEEKMEISSVQYTWKWIVAALELYNIR